MEMQEKKIIDEEVFSKEKILFRVGRGGITEEECRLRMEQLTDKDIAVFDELGDLPAENVHAEAYVVILCLEGKASCKIEGREYHIGKNDMVLANPNQFIQNAMVSCDFKCRGLLMSPAYFESIFIIGGNIWEAGLIIRENPLLHLEDNEAEHFLTDYEFLKHKLAEPHLPHHDQILKLLLQSFVFEFYDNIAPMLNQQVSCANCTSAELIFKRFVSLVSVEFPRRREVGYYADKLCITPKYLSAICKKQVGKTASELINSVTLNYVRNMLASSDRSVKEIAAEVGFENLSFFGKYVRRELGMSPRQVRAKEQYVKHTEEMGEPMGMDGGKAV